MTDDQTLVALYRALDEDPADTLATQALADWYEEHADLDAAGCLRWVVGTGRCPFRYRHGEIRQQSKVWHDGWLWWARSHRGGSWGHPTSCQLPAEVWDKLSHSFDYQPLVFKEYPTVRDAYAALFAVWPGVAPPKEGLEDKVEKVLALRRRTRQDTVPEDTPRPPHGWADVESHRVPDLSQPHQG